MGSQKSKRTGDTWRVGVNGYIIQDRRGETNIGAAFSSTVGAEEGLANAKMMAAGPSLARIVKRVVKGDVDEALIQRAKALLEALDE